MAEFILELASQDYGDPAEYLPYDSGEGGYQVAAVFSTCTLLREHLPFDFAPEHEEDLFAALDQALPDAEWCEKDPFARSRLELLDFSWESFCQQVKDPAVVHQRDPHDGERPVSLAELLDTVLEAARRRRLIRQAPAGLVLFRARYERPGQGRLESALDYGPPSAEKAIKANRMNSPGVPVFYASSHQRTALAETREESGTYGVGRFITTKPVWLLDLAGVIEPADYFSLDSMTRQELLFLRHFAEAIARPVPHDERAHHEYAPTQAVAEYLRTEFRPQPGQALGGIMWPSAPVPGTTSYVLFATRADLVLLPAEVESLSETERVLRGDSPGWLQLTRHRHFHTP